MISSRPSNIQSPRTYSTDMAANKANRAAVTMYTRWTTRAMNGRRRSPRTTYCVYKRLPRHSRPYTNAAAPTARSRLRTRPLLGRLVRRQEFLQFEVDQREPVLQIVAAFAPPALESREGVLQFRRRCLGLVLGEVPHRRRGRRDALLEKQLFRTQPFDLARPLGQTPQLDHDGLEHRLQLRAPVELFFRLRCEHLHVAAAGRPHLPRGLECIDVVRHAINLGAQTLAFRVVVRLLQLLAQCRELLLRPINGIHEILEVAPALCTRRAGCIARLRRWLVGTPRNDGRHQQEHEHDKKKHHCNDLT